MILVVGSINMGIVMSLESIPAPGQTVLSKGKQKFPGGKGANQAVAAAKLGADVTMLGCVGKDADGAELITSLKTAGVNTEHILVTESANTSSSYICVSADGENTIVVDSTANALVTPEYLLLHEELFAQADYCVLQLEIPQTAVKQAIQLCCRYSTKIILNPSPQDMFDLELVDGIDYLISNEEEAASLLFYPSIESIAYDDWIHFLRCQALKNLIITRGKRGAIHYTASGNYGEYPANKQDAVDTTCAGDTFLGAFVAAIDKGHDCDYAIRFANYAASLSVTRNGAQASIPTLNEMIDYQ